MPTDPANPTPSSARDLSAETLAMLLDEERQSRNAALHHRSFKEPMADMHAENCEAAANAYVHAAACVRIVQAMERGEIQEVSAPRNGGDLWRVEITVPPDAPALSKVYFYAPTLLEAFALASAPARGNDGE